jgi:glycosyltransferase involved in cell wall biosynthesis
MNKIKIAFFVSNLGQGGAERQLVELIKSIDKNVFDVHFYLYAYQKETFYKEIFEIKNILIIKNKLKYENYLLKIIEALWYLKLATKRNDYDLIFTTLFMNNLFLRISSPNRYRNKVIANSRNSIKLYSKIHLFTEKILIKNSNLVFNSKDALEDFKTVINKKFHNKLHVIYNGFHIENSFRVGIKSKDLVTIGGLGRLCMQKNFSQLVRVFQLLNNEGILNNKIDLILQGNNGDESKKINNLINENATGISLKKSNPNINNFFNDINIMVLPSHFEGCPNVLFEAMIRKRICVISNGANSDDFVIDGQSGFIYDGSDEGLLKSLKSAISIIGTKKEKEIINNAFNYASKNFGMEVMVNKYEELFKNIYEKNKSSN